MIGLPSSVRVFFAREPCDMRKSFDGLFALVRDFLGQDAMSGHLFVFAGKRGNRLKILYWDRTGLAIWYKRLENSVFHIPKAGSLSHVEMTPADLALVLEGVDLQKTARMPSFELKGSQARRAADQV